MKSFKAPRKALTDLDAETVSRLITASSDVALVLDAKGVVRDAAFGNEQLAAEIGVAIVGKPLTDAVSVDTRPKIELLFADVGAPSDQHT